MGDRSKPIVNSHDMLADYRGNVTRAAHSTSSLNYITPGVPVIPTGQSGLFNGVTKPVISGNDTLAVNFPTEAAGSFTDVSSITVPHPLGYIPTPTVFFTFAGQSFPVTNGSLFSSSLVFTATVQEGIYVSIGTDDMNLYVALIRTAYSTTGLGSIIFDIPFKYYLSQQTAN